MKNRAPNRRAGITRIEIIVVSTMVLILLGLFIVYLQRTWGTSHRLHCQNNLKLIGEATFTFCQQRNVLPSSCIDKGYATWAVQIAPYLPNMQKNDLAHWQFPRDYYSQTDQARKSQIPYFYCPQRRRPGLVSTRGDVPAGAKSNIPGALGDYAACAGDGSAPWDTAKANGALIIGKVLPPNKHGKWRWEGRIPVSVLQHKDKNKPFLEKNSLPRGTSYTILIGEKHVPEGQWGRTSSGDGSLYNGDYFGNFARIGGKGYGIASSISQAYNRNFGSYHTDFCHFLYADNTVKAHSTRIDEVVLGRLCNRFEADY